ncbi:MAG TPA: class I SAM-dependent methyltransferase [Candidatus Nanoarchaeia archaeon]|nr:class I SAM-dependent methyltransferase [Candidatus Nanoarchaeia archaeon]
MEIGSGEGDLTQYILEHNPSLAIDILDVSPEMIERSKEALARYKDRVTFICDDALAYLKRTDATYDAIASAWVIHNFTWDEKHRIFRKIHSCLSPQGALLLMDKVYPGNVKSRWEMAEHQFRRYRYLDEPLRTEILDHEAQDASDSYRMDEKATLKALADAGFSQMHLIDRVERDVLIAAEK